MTLSASNPSAADSSFEKETNAWHDKRLKRLQAEDGWLSVVGLHWLDEGEATVDDLGTFTRKGKTVTYKPALAVTSNGKPFEEGVIASDASGKPDVLRAGSRQFMLVERGDRLGIRVRDSEAPARKHFKGIPRYAVSEAWRKDARFEPATSGQTLPVPNVLGDVKDIPLAGTAIFRHDGQEYRLLATYEDDKLFFVFGDATNRTETYGAGRFLYANAPKDGRVVLDFNQALNPPCAFTPHATCPLPVKENKLKLAVEAGEKRYGDH